MHHQPRQRSPIAVSGESVSCKASTGIRRSGVREIRDQDRPWARVPDHKKEDVVRRVVRGINAMSGLTGAPEAGAVTSWPRLSGCPGDPGR